MRTGYAFRRRPKIHMRVELDKDLDDEGARAMARLYRFKEARGAHAGHCI